MLCCCFVVIDVLLLFVAVLCCCVVAFSSSAFVVVVLWLFVFVFVSFCLEMVFTCTTGSSTCRSTSLILYCTWMVSSHKIDRAK